MQQGATTEEMIPWAAEMGMNLMGGGVPMAEKGAAGIFGGRLAATADKTALAKAEEMAAKGAPREQIWNDTGWFKGADDKWRFEIPDNAAVFTVPVSKRFEAAGVNDPVFMHNADRIMSHPELHGAYPDMWSVNTMLTKGGGYPYTPHGSFMQRESGKQEIALNAPNLDVARSLNLHELQHAVQNREGFSPGANPRQIAAGLSENTGNPVIEELRRAISAGEYGGPADTSFREAARNLLALERQSKNDRAMDIYRRHPGEVEARNVEKRMNMTPEQRRTTPPWLTE
jgi:hypothetical protein